MNEEVLQKLYESAQAHFDMPDYETFKADMENDANLERFRNNMSAHYDMPDFDTLRADVGVKKKDDTESELEDGISESPKYVEAGTPIGVDEYGIPIYEEETPEARAARQDKNKNFWGASFGSGMSRLNEAITSIPNTLYDMAAYPQNKLADVLDLPEDHWLRTSSEEFEETVGVKNTILDYYQEETKKFSEQKQKYIEENFDSASILESAKKGNYSDAFDLLGSGMIESFPTSLGIMASGGAFGAARTAIGTTVALTEGQKGDLRQAFPDATEAELMEKAVMSSAAESVFAAVTTGTLGSLYKDIIKKEGQKAGQEVFKKGLTEMYKKALKKYGAPVGAVGEGIEEATTQITQNLIANRDPMEGVADAFILGTASGGTMAAPLNLIKSGGATDGAVEGGQVELNIPAQETPVEQTPDNQDVVTPENGLFENEQAVEPDTPEIDDSGEVQAQGFAQKDQRRDSSLGEGGPVRDIRGKAKKIKRFLNQTFSSEQGLDRDVVRVTERHRGRITATTKVLEADQRSFGRIVKDIEKNLGKKKLNEGLKAVNDYLAGKDFANPEQVSFLSEENRMELERMRERLDNKSEQLIERIQEQYGNLDQEIASEMQRIEEMQQQKVAENNPLGLDFDVEYQYKSQNLTRLQDKRQRMTDLVETIRGNMGQYLFRSYDAFADEEYINNLTSETPNKEAKRRLDNAVEFVAQDLDITREEAETSVLNYLDGLRNKQDFLSARIDGKMDAPFLRKRNDIPAPIRELLGESKDPIKNYTASYQNIAQYLSSIQYQQELAKTLKDLGIARSTIARGYTQFKTNNQGWDFLEGIYVPVEFTESMEDFRGLDPLNGGWTQAMVNFTGLTKVGKTVFAPTTMARNFLSGVLLSFNSGFIPFTKNVQDSFAIAWGGKKTQKALRDETLKLTELGVVGDGAVSGEIMNILNDMSQDPSALVNKTGVQKIGNVFQRLYALGDDAYKAMGFYVWKDRYVKAGHSETEAEELAATRIRNGFPTYSKLPKNIQALRRFPIVGTFPSFSYEVWRTTRNNFKFVYQDIQTANRTGNQEYRKMAMKQVAGMTAAILAPIILNSLSKSLLGISDEEEETAKNMSPEWQKDAQLIFMKTGDGNVTFMDATALFPSETIIKPLRILLQDREGRTTGEKFGRAMGEAVSPFVGGDILWSTISDLHSNKSAYGQKVYDGDNIIEGIANGDVDKIADYILTNAGAGMYNNIKEFARANADDIAQLPYGNGIVEYFGEKESKYKEYTNLEAVLAFTGFRLSKVDYTQGTVNLIKNAREDFRLIRSRALSQMKVNRIKDAEDVEATVQEENDRNERLHKEALIAVQGYNNQDIPPVRLYQALKAEGISDKNIAALMSGIQPPIGQISRSDLKANLTKVEVGRLRNELEKKGKTQEAMIKNTVVFNEKTAETNMRNMANHLYNLYGDGLLPENFGNLDKESLDAFYILKSQGLLQETANKDFGWAEKTFTALDYYIELTKSE